MTDKAPRLLIAYDLRTEREYKELYSALDSLGAKQIQESVWVVRTAENVVALSLKMQNYIHKNDRLLVVCFSDFDNHEGINDIKIL